MTTPYGEPARALPRGSAWSACPAIVQVATLVMLTGAAVPVVGAVGKPKSSAQERSASFVAEGDEAFERGDYEEAIVKYRAAYYGLTPEQRTSYVGSLPVRNAMRAYALLLAERQDRRVLEQQLGFLTEFLESVRSTAGGVTRVGEPVIAELEGARTDAEQKLAALAQVVAPPPDPEEEEPTLEADAVRPTNDPLPLVIAPDGPPPLEEPDEPVRPPPRRGLGLGLAIGGGVAAGIGAGVMSGWWIVKKQALEEAERQWGDDVTSPEREDYLRAQWYRARRHLVAGCVVGGAGMAAATAGAVLLLVGRARVRDAAPLSLRPTWGPAGTGVLLEGRF